MVKSLKDQEVVALTIEPCPTLQKEFRKMLAEMLQNFFNKEWQEKHMADAMGKINAMTENKGSTEEMIGNLAKLGMAYVTLTMEEVMFRAVLDIEGRLSNEP